MDQPTKLEHTAPTLACLSQSPQSVTCTYSRRLDSGWAQTYYELIPILMGEVGLVVDEIAGKGHSRFRLFGFWKRYRARENQKFIDELASPGHQDVLASREAVREAATEYQMDRIKSGQNIII